MKNLLARLKKLREDMKKHSDLSARAQREWAEVGYEIRKGIGAKLNALKGDAYSPLKGYKWVGQFRDVGGYPGVQYMAVVISAKKKRRHLPDPIETFLGEALTTLAGGLSIPLQGEIVLYDMHDLWEIRFGERGHRIPALVVPNEQIHAYIKERKLRVSISFHELCDYNRAKQFIAECDEFMEVLGKEKK